MKKKEKKPRVRVNLYLDADQAEELKSITEKIHVPSAAIVREGVGLALEKYRRFLKVK